MVLKWGTIIRQVEVKQDIVRAKFWNNMILEF